MIYREARNLYAESSEYPATLTSINVVGNKACFGMCRLIRKAIRTVADRNGVLSLNRVNFPEYFSYKPKTGWKQNPDFWWTISVKNGGAKKRMEIFERLAKGLSKGE